MPTKRGDAALAARVGSRLQSLRMARGLSQEELALTAGVHRTFPSLVERGTRNCTVASIARFCDALDISLAEFFAGLEEPGSDEAGHPS